MQPCNRIYYSTVLQRLNMFRAVRRSPSGAPILFAAPGLHTHLVTGRSQVWVTQTFLRPVTTCVCIPGAANTVGAPDDERRTARNMLSLWRTVEYLILLQGCILLVVSTESSVFMWFVFLCTIQDKSVITTNLKFAFVTMTETLIAAGHDFLCYLQSYKINVTTNFVIPKNLFLTFLV